MEKRMRRSFRTKDKSLVMKRIPFDIFIVFLIVIGSLSACNKMAPPKNPIEEEQKKVLSNKGRLIKDLASPANMMLAKVEGVCLIEGLANTGADEPPSTYQEMVYQELQKVLLLPLYQKANRRFHPRLSDFGSFYSSDYTRKPKVQLLFRHRLAYLVLLYHGNSFCLHTHSVSYFFHFCFV